MTKNQIDQQFCIWAQTFGNDEKSLDRAKQVVLLIRDAAETSSTLTGEILYTIPVYSDALHTFTYAEKTTWQKDGRGNNGEILSVHYEVIATS